MTSWWRNISDIFEIQSNSKGFYHDAIIVKSSLVVSASGSNVPNLGMKSAISNIWPIFIDLWRHVGRHKSDIFYILNIPEIFYYHVIIVMSSLDTLVMSDVTHSTNTFGDL